MRYADLICIGSQKAGTTWLHRMLAGHPDVFTPPLKEVHYFDTLHVPRHRNFQRRRTMRSQRLVRERLDRTPFHKAAATLLTDVLKHGEASRYIDELRFAAKLQSSVVDDAWYATFFAAARPEQVTCDFTPAYSMLPAEGIEHLRRLNPRARVIYILRDPIERALSHARMLVVRNRAPRTPEMLKRYLNVWAVRSRDDSIGTIDRWREHWPADQFRVVFYDDIAARPLALLEEICSFAGLAFDPDWFPRYQKVIYRGPRIAASESLKGELKARFAPLLGELRRRYPERADAWGQTAGARHRSRLSFPLPRFAGELLHGISLRLAVGVASLALFASAAAGGYYSVVKAAGNMHVVVAEELYRSAQPSADQIADYSRRYGIKTIVNLRGGHTGEAWYDSELSEARSLGITHVDFPIAPRKDLSEGRAAKLVGLLEAAEKPVLIHCDDGASRTGLASALYVAAVKKLGEDAAEDQLSMRFGSIPLPLTSAFVMDRSFEALEPWLGYSDS